MKTFHEEAHDIPVAGSYDVIVAGGGPAGIAAAMAAGKHGAKTIIIERLNSLGGMAVPGMMSHWGGTCGSAVFRELLEKCAAEPWPGENITQFNAINHDKQRLVLIEMMEKYGVTIQFHTVVAGVSMDGNRVTGVITESKSGREMIEGKVVIDCTGDGDAAYAAGAEYSLGRETDHRMQPVTLMFKIGGVDYERAIFPGSFETLVDVPKGEIQALGKSILPHPAGHVLLYPNPVKGIVVINMTNVIDIDGTNVRDLTKAEIVCAKQMPKIVAFLREYAPGYENCYIVSSAMNVGVRETRHFKGMYEITAEDILEGRTFDDWIATHCSFNFDIHNLDGAGLDKNGAQQHFHAKGTYTIPYRACLPVNVEGLLLAGRDISGTHKAHSNYRIMSVCAGMGEGCGVAAALAAKQNILPRDVNVKEVQEILTEDGITF